MNLPNAQPINGPTEDEEPLRDALARGNRMLGKIGPILGYLIETPDHSLFSDEIVARVKGMFNDLAWQVLRAQAEATGHAGREEFADRHGDALSAHLQANPALLAHCHALAIEWQLTARMEAFYGLDPVLTPQIQDLIASDDSTTASAAMAALAAQARFAQAQRRMELPLSELPGDLFHETLLRWRDWNGANRSDAIIRAEAKLRNAYDEGDGRLALFARLVAGMGPDAASALNLDHAGVAIFFTALSVLSGQTRETALLSSNERQIARLALGLRAAGLEGGPIRQLILKLHPEALPPREIDGIDPREAHAILADGAVGGIG